MKTYMTLDIPVRKVTLVEPGSKAPTHLEVKVYYSLGGYNNWQHKQERRGIYASAAPTEIGESDGGFRFRTIMLSTPGTKRLLEETKRQNDKKGEALAEDAAREVREKTGRTWELVQHVLSENGLELVEDLAEIRS